MGFDICPASHSRSEFPVMASANKSIRSSEGTRRITIVGVVKSRGGFKGSTRLRILRMVCVDLLTATLEADHYREDGGKAPDHDIMRRRGPLQYDSQDQRPAAVNIGTWILKEGTWVDTFKIAT